MYTYKDRSQEFHLGERGSTWEERTNEWPKATRGSGESSWNFCSEMVNFGAKENNAVHRHWFSDGYREKNGLKTVIKFSFHNFGGGGS